MAFSNGYVFGFAMGCCVVCSLGVSSAALGLRDMQLTNKTRDMQSSILSALNLPEDGSSPEGEQIDELWKSRVQLLTIDATGKLVEDRDLTGDGKTDEADVEFARSAAKGSGKPPEILAVYARKDDHATGAYAIPMYGAGLWGPISGYLALKPNAEEVLGATFFAPKETPGLGAEIVKEPFKKQWVGKKIAQNGSMKAIRVVKGSASLLCADSVDYCVDGISGATITSRGVDGMVVEALSVYDPYLTQLRAGGGGQ
jgi:Na+-transporting NADH:ubiquinone oxidoreductase subunit C